MKRLLGLLTSGMNAYMDFAVGVCLAAVLATALHQPILLWMLFAGGVLALLPDFDIVVPIVLHDTIDYEHHQTLFHRPLFMFLVTSVLGFLWVGLLHQDAYWVILTLSCLLWHYVHDTPPLGKSGISWFWPFVDQYVSMRGFAEPIDMQHEVWLERYWLRPSAYAVWEISVGTFALAATLCLLSAPAYLYFALLTCASWGPLLIWEGHKRYTLV